MADLLLDNSKRVFLAPSCKDQKTTDNILKILDGYKVSENKIFKEIDMDIMKSGDYLIRCLNNEIKLFVIELTLPFGFITHFMQNL
ncbi:MAG: hypothetical protein ACREA3_06405 [Nitrosotalea sp.]